MKRRIKNFTRYKIELSPAEERAILEYLRGKLSCRALGEFLEVSHQQAINFVSQVCRQWVQEGKLKT